LFYFFHKLIIKKTNTGAQYNYQLRKDFIMI